VSEEIAAKLQSGSYSMLSINDPKLYKAVTGHLSVMLCGRMHPAILAAGMGTPVVGLSYNQKFSGMFELLGQGSRCLPMSDFVRNSETARLGSMLREAIRQPTVFRPDTKALERRTQQFVDALAGPASFLQTADSIPRA
jgi:polysaccharide pyruvyl transferase WcaK-like protein